MPKTRQQKLEELHDIILKAVNGENTTDEYIVNEILNWHEKECRKYCPSEDAETST